MRAVFIGLRNNIDEGREKSLHEIARVLRLGGVAVISDLAETAEYAEVFRKLGFVVEHGPLEWGTFPFQRVVVARKPR